MHARSNSLKSKLLPFHCRAVVILGLCFSALLMLVEEGGTQPAATPGRLDWIDVHVHLVGGRGSRQDYQGAVRAALAAMDEAGIRTVVVMPPPQAPGMPLYDYDSFFTAIKSSPTRFAFLGGGGSLNPMLLAAQDKDVSDELRREFQDKADEILQQGAAGFGEVTAHHLSHTSGHPYESVAADHPLLLLLADIAARNEALIDFHFDVVTEEMKAPKWLSSPPNPQLFRANLAGFERLLEHNRKAKMVWAHAGSDMLGHWTTELSRRLLEKHPNLYMSLRMAPGRAPQNHPLGPGKEVGSGWLRLLQDFPDRFVIGGDQFFVSPSVQGGGPGVFFSQRAPMIRERTRVFLTALPADLSRKIGFENASRLYRLKVGASAPHAR